jgi:hypothetical protein
MSDRQFSEWAIVELMGHRKLAGHVTEQEIAGSAFLRLDIHDSNSDVVTQFYSPGAVYCITPTTEEIARKIGDRSKPQPALRHQAAELRDEVGDLRSELAAEKAECTRLRRKLAGATAAELTEMPPRCRRG